MKTDLSGNVALVTGGSKGYGVGIASALRKKGMEVWITARNEASLNTAAQDFDLKPIRADVTSPDDWDRVFETVLDQSGRLDVLVNNAGGGINIGSLVDMTDNDVEQTIALNLTSVIFGCRRAARVMSDQKSGAIINISSICQRQAWPGWSAYSAAKSGLGQFSKCLYTELRPYGVRVTTVIPSWGATDFLETAGLTDRSPEANARSIQIEDMGDMVVTICELPQHLELQDMTLLPIIQPIEPL